MLAWYACKKKVRYSLRIGGYAVHSTATGLPDRDAKSSLLAETEFSRQKDLNASKASQR
jgi:hypothetical protein